MSEGCHFCGRGEGVLEQHHIIPRRMGGPDREDNLVGLCPTCHRKLERLYDDEFFARIGAADEANIEHNPSVEEVLLQVEAALLSIRPGRSLIPHEYVGIIRDGLDVDWDQCSGCERLLFVIPANHPENDFDYPVCGKCGWPVDGQNGRPADV